MAQSDQVTCPHCGEEIPDDVVMKESARLISGRTSEKKAASSRENGKKGGRPKTNKKDVKEIKRPESG